MRFSKLMTFRNFKETNLQTVLDTMEQKVSRKLDEIFNRNVSEIISIIFTRLFSFCNNLGFL